MNAARSGPSNLLLASHESQPSLRLLVATGCAALNSANLGFDIGVIGGAAVFIVQDFTLSEVETEVLMGVLNFCAIIGAAVSHVLTDRYGRCRTFAISSVVFIVGVTLMASAPSYGPLLLGRVITGIGTGFGFAIDPLYISEISPKHYRGRLVTASEIGLNVGIILGFVADYAFRGLPPSSAWRSMLGAGLIMPLFIVVLSATVMPESPRWLVAHGRRDEAAVTLAKLHGSDCVETTIAEIVEAVEHDRSIAALGWQPILRPSRGVRRALVVGVGIAAAQHSMATESIIFYLPSILDGAGITSTTRVFTFQMIMGVIKTACVVVSAAFLDRAGRRPMLLVGVLGMGLALCLLAVSLIGQSSPAFAISAVYLYMAAFSLGIGPGCWLVASEVFPLHVRAKAMALCTIANRLVATLIAMTFLSLVRVMSYSGYYIMFAAVAAAVWAFVYRLLPETKGRTLEEMERHFEAAASGTPGYPARPPPPGRADAVMPPRAGSIEIVAAARAAL